MVDAQIVRLAERQHGLISRVQARERLTAGQLRRRITSGQLIPVRTAVYRLAGAPVSWEQQVLAAVLVAGEGAVASFATAAALWGLAGFDRDEATEVTTPSRRRSRIPGVKVHDSRVLSPLHVTRHRSIPITSVARTLCDLTACRSYFQVARAVDEALRRRLTTLATLEKVFHDLRTKGRRRSTYMRAILEDRLPGFHPGDSDPEVKLVRWLVGAGLGKPVQQHRIRIGTRTFKIDLAYPVHRIAIEYDGWETHRPRSVFDADRMRDNALRLAGWQVLRFTSSSPREYVVQTVRDAIKLATK
jgi:very-short-patch-repair endonuclease/predicted transcriptional regulator of viral defense system